MVNCFLFFVLLIISSIQHIIIVILTCKIEEIRTEKITIIVEHYLIEWVL